MSRPINRHTHVGFWLAGLMVLAMSGALSTVSLVMGLSVVLWAACAVPSLLAFVAWRGARLHSTEVVDKVERRLSRRVGDGS
jgi:hypothetical protein